MTHGNASGSTHHMVLCRDGAKVNVAIPALGLIASGASADAAIAVLEERKAALLREFTELGLSEHLAQVQAARSQGSSDTRRFAVKAAITAAACIAVCLVATISVNLLISHQVNRMVAAIESVGNGLDPNFVARTLTDKLDKIAERARTMNPEIRDRFAANLHLLVQQAKPISDELRPLLCPAGETRAVERR